jgi:alkylation response protein AidB-like acyl-CoA dehydrogenase
MSLGLTPEQVMLQQAAQRYFADCYDDRARRKRRDMPERFSRETWREMAELGWLGAGFSEEEGGFGGGVIETMILMEEAGSALVQEPLLSSMVVAGRLLAEAEQDISSLLSGDEIIVPALTEKDRLFDPFKVEATICRAEGGYVVRGVKNMILDGGAADYFIVTAREGDRKGALVLLRLPADAKGVRVLPFPTMDGRSAALLDMENIGVGEEAVIARGAHAERALSAATDHAIVAICAEAVGVSRSLLDRTIDYLKTRCQFGQPIGRFQALQHRAADMFIAHEEARSLALMAAAALALPEVDRRQRLSAAKVGVMARTLHVGREAIQLHGGVGMTDELPVGDGFKRLKVLSFLFGDEHFHLERMGEAGCKAAGE